MKPKIIVYLPVIHAGYLQFLNQYKTADILIANESLIALIDQEFDYLRKEIRAIQPQQAEKSLEALLPGRNISLLGANDLAFLNDQEQTIILPREDIFLWLAEKYLNKSKVTFGQTFLRWNRTNSLQKQEIKTKNNNHSDFSKKILAIIKKTKKETDLSSDWWRQVGAVVFQESSIHNQQPKILAIAHNHHIPSPYSPYIDSDPRNAFHKGEHIELSTAIHAEAALIADCAKKGVSLLRTSMYVSTFPCPVCAKLIAASGISRLYYSDGYAMLDGEKILKDVDIKIATVTDD